jgi:phospholipid/cholesterol/gamma-HCH transport system substrate-binding protein
MNEKTVNKVKLGAFVFIATACLIIGLYYIGSKKNIFHSTITVSTLFNNVGGLMPGNNVRFNGINVGTVSEVYSVSDTSIKVEFSIDEASTLFISQNAIVSIGTDGLLGNKLINVLPGKGMVLPVKDGDELRAVNPIQVDNALRTLTITNDNLQVISENLKGVSQQFNNNNSLWQLLADTAVAGNVRSAIVNFRITGKNTAVLTGDLSKIAKDIKAGKGSVGTLLTDTLIADRLNQTIINIQSVSDSLAFISGNFSSFSRKLNNDNGAIGTLLTDTSFVNDLNKSLQNIKDGAGGFNENMEALKYSWPFKKYFRKQKDQNHKK